MVGHSDSKIKNSYSDDSEFKEKESEILLGLSNGGFGFCGHGEGTFVCPFCHGKKVPSWSLRKLLQHTNGKSRRGKGISGLEHSALAKYILSNDQYILTRGEFLNRLGVIVGHLDHAVVADRLVLVVAHRFLAVVQGVGSLNACACQPAAHAALSQ